MNGALAEKAGLKTWLGSKGNRTVFPSRGIERGPRVRGRGAVARRTRRTRGRVVGSTMGGARGRADVLTHPPHLCQGNKKEGSQPFGEGSPIL